MPHTRFLLCTLLLTCSLSAADKKAIRPKEFVNAAGPSLPYTPGILIDGTLYAAGQTGRDLKTNKVPEDFETEVKTCLDNIGIVLKEAGMGFEDAVAVQVYLTDMDLFPRMNAVYSTYFKDPRPARTTVGVSKLVGPARIEITITAHK
jgi:2-iminobutanoate/2-iminopropanoate deaminase